MNKKNENEYEIEQLAIAICIDVNEIWILLSNNIID